MRYAESRFLTFQREETYRIFVTESLKLIAENTAAFAGGKIIKTSYAEILKNTSKPVSNESYDEIIARIKKGLAES